MNGLLHKGVWQMATLFLLIIRVRRSCFQFHGMFVYIIHELMCPDFVNCIHVLKCKVVSLFYNPLS